jgi:hypothetical protein
MKQQIEDIVKANWEYDNVEVEKIVEQIIELYKPIVQENAKMVVMLDEVYLATCDFDIDLFYPDKAERYNKISNEIWQFINREPISNNEA